MYRSLTRAPLKRDQLPSRRAATAGGAANGPVAANGAQKGARGAAFGGAAAGGALSGGAAGEEPYDDDGAANGALTEGATAPCR